MQGHAKMTYVRFNVNRELKKAARGKPTKIPVLDLVYIALNKYPVIQKQFAKAAGITRY